MTATTNASPMQNSEIGIALASTGAAGSAMTWRYQRTLGEAAGAHRTHFVFL